VLGNGVVNVPFEVLSIFGVGRRVVDLILYTYTKDPETGYEQRGYWIGEDSETKSLLFASRLGMLWRAVRDSDRSRAGELIGLQTPHMRPVSEVTQLKRLHYDEKYRPLTTHGYIYEMEVVSNFLLQVVDPNSLDRVLKLKSVREIGELIVAGRYFGNSCLVWVDHFLRHGYLDGLNLT
jgi:hypothetical protein